jgi:hypothetical protein
MFAKFYIISSFLFSSCGFLKSSQTPKINITGVKVTQAFPIINNKGKLEGYDTSSSYIYYNKNLVLYKLPYQYNSFNTNGILDTSETRYHFFVYKKGDSVGYDYDIHKFPSGIRITTDSIFKQAWVIQNKVYPIILDNKSTLISKHENRDSGMLYELYSIKGKTDTTRSGSIFLGFTNRLKNVNYSLSEELDSINKMKLVKVKIVADERYFKDYNVTMDRYEISRWMEKISGDNDKKILDYFQRYKRDSQKK